MLALLVLAVLRLPGLRLAMLRLAVLRLAMLRLPGLRLPGLRLPISVAPVLGLPARPGLRQRLVIGSVNMKIAEPTHSTLPLSSNTNRVRLD